MKLQPWQTKILEQVANTKNPCKEIVLFTSGRNVGKSMLNSMYGQYMAEFSRPAFHAYDSGEVDDELWYTVDCSKEVAAWVRTHDRSMWYEHITNINVGSRSSFDVHNHVYTMMNIKWSDA